MKAIEYYDMQMEEMRRRYDALAEQLQDAIVELRAVGIAVEKLKANVKYIQDGMI